MTSTLAVQVGSDPVQDVVTGATYLFSGPLATLTLGNATTETRLHDGRYTPAAILLEGPAPRSWLYTTDPVGNILEIQEHEGCAELPLELSGLTIPDIQALTTCSEITADTTTVTATGDLTLTAGTRIAFGDGFQVETGGLRIDPLGQRSRVAGLDPRIGLVQKMETRARPPPSTTTPTIPNKLSTAPQPRPGAR